jgi:hypothetical protein
MSPSASFQDNKSHVNGSLCCFSKYNSRPYMSVMRFFSNQCSWGRWLDSAFLEKSGDISHEFQGEFSSS